MIDFNEINEVIEKADNIIKGTNPATKLVQSFIIDSLDLAEQELQDWKDNYYIREDINDSEKKLFRILNNLVKIMKYKGL